jgi:hypothetical protein
VPAFTFTWPQFEEMYNANLTRRAKEDGHMAVSQLSHIKEVLFSPEALEHGVRSEFKCELVKPNEHSIASDFKTLDSAS